MPSCASSCRIISKIQCYAWLRRVMSLSCYGVPWCALSFQVVCHVMVCCVAMLHHATPSRIMTYRLAWRLGVSQPPWRHVHCRLVSTRVRPPLSCPTIACRAVSKWHAMPSCIAPYHDVPCPVLYYAVKCTLLCYTNFVPSRSAVSSHAMPFLFGLGSEHVGPCVVFCVGWGRPPWARPQLHGAMQGGRQLLAWLPPGPDRALRSQWATAVGGGGQGGGALHCGGRHGHLGRCCSLKSAISPHRFSDPAPCA